MNLHLLGFLKLKSIMVLKYVKFTNYLNYQNYLSNKDQFIVIANISKKVKIDHEG